MAKKTFHFFSSGASLVYHVMNLNGQRWNGSALVTYVQGNFATYNQTITEDAGSSLFQGPFPAAIPYGKYILLFYQDIGGSYYPAGAGAIYHDGTNEVASIWDDLKTNHSTQGTFGENNFAVISASAAAGSLNTLEMTTNLTEATNDHYNRRVVVFITGNLVGQAQSIKDYDGATKKITFNQALTEAPAVGNQFVIV
jgi:hypothetical protein